MSMGRDYVQGDEEEEGDDDDDDEEEDEDHADGSSSSLPMAVPGAITEMMEL